MSPAMQRFKKRLTADKKKFGLFLTLLALGLLLWGRLLLQPVPRTAVADPKLMPVTAQASPGKAAEGGSSARRVVNVVLHDVVERDLFALQAELFPRAEEEKPSALVEKYPAQKPDDLERARLAVQAAARELKLQTTMLGSQPRALINGVLLERGQAIGGFELMEISSRQVTLKKDGVVVVLEM